jgi:hypothetical protein
MTYQRGLYVRHVLGLSLTRRAPSDNRLLQAAGNDNLFRINDDFGVPFTHVRLSFRALPNGLMVIESCELVWSFPPVRQRSRP